jgi:hypothetical protein
LTVVGRKGEGRGESCVVLLFTEFCEEDHVTCVGKKINAYRVLVGKPEGVKLLGRPRRRWEDNIKVDIEYYGRAGSGLVCFGIGESVWLLRTQYRKLQNSKIARNFLTG